MYCLKCGEKLENDSRFCPACGTVVDQQKSESTAAQGPQIVYRETHRETVQPGYISEMAIRNYRPGYDYTPIGMWGYFLYGILFNIPFVGIICILLFSFGVTKNINLRNYARSWFCTYIIAVILILIFSITTGFVAMNL